MYKQFFIFFFILLVSTTLYGQVDLTSRTGEQSSLAAEEEEKDPGLLEEILTDPLRREWLLKGIWGETKAVGHYSLATLSGIASIPAYIDTGIAGLVDSAASAVDDGIGNLFGTDINFFSVPTGFMKDQKKFVADGCLNFAGDQLGKGGDDFFEALIYFAGAFFGGD